MHYPRASHPQLPSLLMPTETFFILPQTCKSAPLRSLLQTWLQEKPGSPLPPCFVWFPSSNFNFLQKHLSRSYLYSNIKSMSSSLMSYTYKNWC